MSKDELKDRLNVDPLYEAEKITGNSYKEDDDTVKLGFTLQMMNSHRKNLLLQQSDDTTLRNTVDEYLRIVQDIGFELLLKEPFVNAEGITEHLYILFHYEYSILLKFDSYTYGDDGSWAANGKEVPPPGVNGGSFYYNILIKADSNRAGITSSGHFIWGENRDIVFYDDDANEVPDAFLHDKPYREELTNEQREHNEKTRSKYNFVWSGDHDCREAIRFKIEQLSTAAKFIEWKETPHLTLLSYIDWKKDDIDVEELTQERLKKLPEKALKQMGMA